MVDAQWDENEMQRMEAERKHKRGGMMDVIHGVYSIAAFFMAIGVLTGWWEVKNVVVVVLSMAVITGFPSVRYLARLIFSWFVNMIGR